MKDFKIKYIFYTIHGYFSLLIIILISIIIFIPVIIIYLFNKNIFLICTRFLVRLLFFLYFSPLDKYFKNIKKDNRKKIYVINHLSLIDGLLVYLIPDNIRVMGNAIYGKIPLLGLGFKLIGNIPVSKKDQGNTLYLYYTAKEYIEKGYSIVIFPEGTRSRMGGMQKFQNGAFYLALDAKADIVPIVFDTWNFLRPKSFFIRERNIHIQVLDTIKYENIKDFSPKEISNLTKTKMIEALINIREKNMYNYNYSSFIEELKKELSSLLKNSK